MTEKKKILFVDEKPQYGLREILKGLSKEYEIDSNIECCSKEAQWKYWETTYGGFHDATSTLGCGDYSLRFDLLVTSLDWNHETAKPYYCTDGSKTLREIYGADEHGGTVWKLRWMKSKLPNFPVIIYSACHDFEVPEMRALFRKEGGVEAIIRKKPGLWGLNDWKTDCRKINRVLEHVLNKPVQSQQ